MPRQRAAAARRHGLPVALAALAGLALAGAACSGGSEPAAGGGAIAPAELAQRIEAGDAPVVLDVRTPEEFESGHIPGALNVPHTELADRIDELGLEPSEEIVVHCERGGRAAQAEAVLREKGFDNVLDLEGHMQAWRGDGLPVE